MEAEQQEGEPKVGDLAKLDRLMAGLYYFMAKEMVDTLGEKQGEEALRRAVRAFGEWRGRTLREQHLAQGLTPSIENLMKYGDNPDLPEQIATRRRELTANRSVAEVDFCLKASVKEELGGRDLGVIYCEEIHPSFYGSYLPGVQITHTQYLLKGDPICYIELNMPEEKS